MPSGIALTSSSNRCTTSGRERCSFSMICMREMKRCFCASRSLISSICLSSTLDLRPQPLVALVLGVDHRAEQQIGDEGHHRGQHRGAAERDEEGELALAALLVAPGK